MKRKILFFSMMLTFAVLFSLQSCKEDDVASYSEFSSFTDPVILAPANGGYVSVSSTTVELKWSAESADGDAQNWDVYFGTSHTPPLVKAGNTSQSYTVTVAKGVEYFWNVIGRDANGVPARSETWSFSVIDPAAEMVVGMSWATDVATSIGLDLDPEEVTDMRLLVLKASDKSQVAVADGAEFEEFAEFNTLPDGTYLIATDIFATINAGDFNEPVSVDIELTFNQEGIIDQAISFPKVLDNLSPCDDYFTVLATVVKTGTSYVIQKSVSKAWSADIADLTGAWNGMDNFDYDSQVVTSVSGTEMKITGMGFEWLSDFWGEEIQTSEPVDLVIDWNSSGNFTIPNQYFLTTLYAGDLYDYNVVGSGTFITCGDSPVMLLKFDLVQDGFSTGTWLFNNKYAATKFFTMEITLGPSGKGVAKGTSGAKGIRLINKPTH